MKVLITGANGFIGKNLCAHLSKRDDIELIRFTRDNDVSELDSMLENVDLVFHLAGINRPKNVEEFNAGNVDFTKSLCQAIGQSTRQIPVVFTSSIQAGLDNPYGESKLLGEKELLEFNKETGMPVYIFRLANVFGKWCKPNYNSVVATFCFNILNDFPIQINEPTAKINLVYVDDVIKQFIMILDGSVPSDVFCEISPVFTTSVGELAEKIKNIKTSRHSLVTERVGVGLDRALHATFLSYFTPQNFSYSLVKHGDERGVFVEMLKTKDSGQFSYFSAHPGVTRGGHFHHTKTEKFLVLNGLALFKFRNIVTDEYYQIEVSGSNPTIVETVPGWTHDITNIGENEMFVMLWANEIFDPEIPDTFAQLLV